MHADPPSIKLNLNIETVRHDDPSTHVRLVNCNEDHVGVVREDLEPKTTYGANKLHKYIA